MTGEELAALLRRRLPRLACEIRHGVVNGFVAAIVVLPEKAEELVSVEPEAEKPALVEAQPAEEKRPEESASRKESAGQRRPR